MLFNFFKGVEEEPAGLEKLVLWRNADFCKLIWGLSEAL
jgi:hypothetical protein